MIGRIDASAIRSEEGRTSDMSAVECAAYLQRYAGSKMRLWVYDRSHSKLVVRATEVPSNLAPFDMLFTSTDDVRCPVFWTCGEVELERGDQHVRFLDRSSGVAILASDIVIVIQDRFPDSIWEFQPFSQNA